jgi:hypothetical protein
MKLKINEHSAKKKTEIAVDQGKKPSKNPSNNSNKNRSKNQNEEYDVTTANLRAVLIRNLDVLLKTDERERLKERYRKFRLMGEWLERFA